MLARPAMQEQPAQIYVPRATLLRHNGKLGSWANRNLLPAQAPVAMTLKCFFDFLSDRWFGKKYLDLVKLGSGGSLV